MKLGHVFPVVFCLGALAWFFHTGVAKPSVSMRKQIAPKVETENQFVTEAKNHLSLKVPADSSGQYPIAGLRIPSPVMPALPFSNSDSYADQQPNSIVESSAEEYVLCGSPDITFSTMQTPHPNSPDDAPDGEPYYAWDLDNAHARDNGDGTITFFTDQDGEYSVSVVCYQDFTDSNGNTYTAQTQASDN